MWMGKCYLMNNGEIVMPVLSGDNLRLCTLKSEKENSPISVTSGSLINAKAAKYVNANAIAELDADAILRAVFAKQHEGEEAIENALANFSVINTETAKESS